MSFSCTGCGAENHHFAFKCSFCGNPLQKVETASLSTEEIIAQLSLWIGRLRECRAYDVEINHNGIKTTYSFEDATGITRQYLGLLQVRAISQPEIISMHNNYKKEIDIDIPAYHKSKEKKDWTFIILVGVGILFLYGLGFYGKKHGWF